MQIIVVANSRIRIRMYFRDLPPTFSGVGTDKGKVPFGSVFAVINGGVYLVTCFPVVAIGTGMVTGEVTSMGPAIIISLELTS